jgi:hypothetical protein
MCAFNCEILNQVGLIMIILWVKSSHIHMNDQLFQKWLYAKIENLRTEVMSHKGFLKKRDMSVIPTL